MGSFGIRLRTLRKDKKMTIAQLAELCKSSENVIRSYEKSRRMPSSEMMLRICEVLKIHPNYLYQDELSFNPYEEHNELFGKIEHLPPDKYQFVVDMVNALERQELEKQGLE